MTTFTDTIGRAQLTGTARTYYSGRIRNEQRSRAIIHRFVRQNPDPGNENTHTCTYTRVYDIPSNIAALTELSDTVPHSWLDSDTFSVTTSEYGHSMRATRIHGLETFWEGGLDPVIRDRLARHYVDSAERQCLNEYLTCESEFTSYRHYGPPGSAATSRITLATTDIANADMVENALVALEARDVSTAFSGNQGNGIFMLCHPFVLADIIQEDANVVTAALYAGAQRQFEGFRPPLWNGVVPVCSTKMILKSAGLYNDATYGVQTTLTSAANGQSTAGGTKTLAVTDGSNFANGDIVAIHPVADGHNILNTSTSLEYGEVASGGGTNTLTLKRPLTHDHASGAYVTKSYDVFPVIFLGADFEGGETVVRSTTLEVSMYPLDYEAAMSLSNPLPRFQAISWYGIYGYDLISPWNMELYLVRSSKTAKLNVPK